MKKGITETKKEILAGLENKSRQKYWYEKFLEAENKLNESLDKLRNFDIECDCEEREIIFTIAKGDEHYGGEYVCVGRCLNCGGYYNEEEWG